MSRPTNWQPFFWCDPTSGDPVAVREAGEDYVRVAALIEAAAADLRAIAGAFTQSSEAITEVEGKSTRLADQIESAQGRYAATGAALVEYSAGLEYAQSVSLDGLTSAQYAAQAQVDAEDSVWYWTRRALDEADPAMAAEHTARANAARRQLSSADQQLADAMAQMYEAIALRDAAADAARSAIKAAVGADDLHDSFWQNVGGGLKKTGEWLWEHVDEISAGLGLLALVLCWVPGIGQALGALAAIAGALCLIRDSVNLATGNGSWKDVGISALGVISFGVGRVAAQGLRIAANSGRAAQGLRTLTVAGESAETAATAARGAASATRGAGGLVDVGAESGSVALWRSGELWGVLRPSAIASDTMSDLARGVNAVRAPGMYATRAPGLHTLLPGGDVSNPFSQARTALSATWNTNKPGVVFQFLGKEGVARDAGFVLKNPGAGAGWLAFTGATQAVDTGVVGYNASVLGQGLIQ